MPVQGRNEWGQGGNNSAGAQSLWGRQITAGPPKSTKNVIRIFSSTVNLLSKELRFEHGSAKLVSCPGRHRTSLRPCTSGLLTPFTGKSSNLIVSAKPLTSEFRLPSTK